MTIRILLISDIHGNYPALEAIDRQLKPSAFQFIVNSGDSLVYAPFANETLSWLAEYRAVSILGNTDQKVIKLLKGKSFKKPGKPEKRIMYTSSAEVLTKTSRQYLLSLKKTSVLKLHLSAKPDQKLKKRLGIFHGSPADHNEFLFDDTPDARFHELAKMTNCHIVVTGHSHTPYHKFLSNVHFINPGSVGRMFDGDPKASCATLEITENIITVKHYRIAYDIEKVVSRIRENNLPEIYVEMYRDGKKLN